MNLERFEEILAAYGTHRNNWPASHVIEMDELLLRVDTQAVLARYHALDELLDDYAVRQPRISAITVTARTTKWLDNLIAWFVPTPQNGIRPAMAASFLLATGILIGSFAADTQEIDTSEDEIYLLALDQDDSYE